ncbi:hypothetical protein [Vibrio gallicus]|uniref:hypothetical protein n=1 Tax=Vibrio gallicus TaxID=190897 RepID=UPI0021C3F060|nr:hypothetical protein [Vibrio gallicus]
MKTFLQKIEEAKLRQAKANKHKNVLDRLNASPDMFNVECEAYADLMKSKGVTNISVMNSIVTRESLWNNFTAIRAISDFGDGRDTYSVSRSAYKQINTLLGRSSNPSKGTLDNQRRF